MVTKAIFLITVSFLFISCSNSKIQVAENDYNLEEKLLIDFLNNQRNEDKIVSKWIQPDNKYEECKIYFETTKEEDKTKSSNFKIFWDGDCENGYAKGIGREFEKGILIDDYSISIYENAPLEKPKYVVYKSNLKNLEIKGDILNGNSVYKIDKGDKELYRFGNISKNDYPKLLTYETQDNDSVVFKKIYPNFLYEIIFYKKKNSYEFYLKHEDKTIVIDNPNKRNSIVNEILIAKDESLKNEKVAILIEKQYKRRVCNDYISSTFMSDREYKSICSNENYIVKNENSNSYKKEFFDDELEYLLQNVKQEKLNENSYAIIIGIEDYLLESNVNYSHNSAKMFMKYAKKILGVPEENIWAFVEDRKTSAGFIKSQWSQFLSLVPKDATIYFYYSGHGVPGIDGNPYILPSDTNAETIVLDEYFMLNNIYKDLTSSNASKVVAFIDSCFSGKDDNGNLLFGGVAPILKTNPIKFNQNKMTLFTAGSASEFSNQYKEKKHRLFSYYLMKGLAKGYTNSSDLYTFIKKNVSDKSRKMGFAYKQIPQLLGSNLIEIK